MKFQPTIDALLKEACPSIQYRIRTEILGESPSSPVNKKIQQAILDDALVKEACSWQLPDGHFGQTLTDDVMGTGKMLGIVHGKNGLEQGMKVLTEKGVSADDAHVVKALAVIDAIPAKARIDGFLTIASAAYGITDRDYARRACAEALAKFERLSVLTAMDEIVGKGKRRVFKRGVLWPDVYDLAVLACTQEWRSPANEDMMRTAVAKILDFYPEPENVAGRFIRWGTTDKWGVFEFVWFKLSPALPGTPGQWSRLWFKNLEHLSRLPFLLELPGIESLLTGLMAVLDQGHGWFMEAVAPRSFIRWTWAYDGLALEDCSFLKPPYEWASEEGLVRDLTFRSLMILHNFGMLET